VIVLQKVTGREQAFQCTVIVVGAIHESVQTGLAGNYSQSAIIEIGEDPSDCRSGLLFSGMIFVLRKIRQKVLLQRVYFQYFGISLMD
jgi:hypothetical protein